MRWAKFAPAPLMAAGEASMRLFDDERTLGVLMEVVEEYISARLLRLDFDRDLGVRLDHLLELQRLALELHGLRAQVLDLEHDRGASRGLELGRRKLVILDRDLEGCIFGSHRRCGKREGACDRNGNGCFLGYHWRLPLF